MKKNGIGKKIQSEMSKELSYQHKNEELILKKENDKEDIIFEQMKKPNNVESKKINQTGTKVNYRSLSGNFGGSFLQMEKINNLNKNTGSLQIEELTNKIFKTTNRTNKEAQENFEEKFNYNNEDLNNNFKDFTLLIDNINDNHLDFYYDKNSAFKKRIDDLNLKFYLETEKYLKTNNKINDTRKTQSNLLLILFKQINLLINEVERLNKIILSNKSEFNSLILRNDNLIKKQNDFLVKENIIKSLKEGRNLTEKKLSETLVNEDKLIKDNERLRKEIEYYKSKLSSNENRDKRNSRDKNNNIYYNYNSNFNEYKVKINDYTFNNKQLNRKLSISPKNNQQNISSINSNSNINKFIKNTTNNNNACVLPSNNSKNKNSCFKEIKISYQKSNIKEYSDLTKGNNQNSNYKPSNHGSNFSIIKDSKLLKKKIIKHQRQNSEALNQNFHKEKIKNGFSLTERTLNLQNKSYVKNEDDNEIKSIFKYKYTMTKSPKCVVNLTESCQIDKKNENKNNNILKEMSYTVKKNSENSTIDPSVNGKKEGTKKRNNSNQKNNLNNCKNNNNNNGKSINASKASKFK